jgi:hypothetical protein
LALGPRGNQPAQRRVHALEKALVGGHARAQRNTYIADADNSFDRVLNGPSP